MKIKKLTIPVLLGILAIVLAFVGFKILTANKSVYFIQYNSYVASPVNSSYTLDLGYFMDKNSKDSLTNETVGSVFFKGSKLTHVTNINFSPCSESSKYRIKTLSLDVKFTNQGKETINELDIFFRDGTKKTFPIGNWQFDINNSPVANFVQTTTGLPIACSKLSNYSICVNNTSDKEMKVNNLIFKNDGVNIDFTPFSVKSSESLTKTFQATSTSNSKHSVYFIKPRIEIACGDKTYSYYPPGSYYGIMNLSEKDMEDEIAKVK